MKTLFININGADIENRDDLVVVGRPENNIINSFYFELGSEILDAVSGTGKISKRELLLGFKAHDEVEFKKITSQWEELKKILLGESPSGYVEIELPKEFAAWLDSKGNRIYKAVAKSIHERDYKVSVSVDNIYSDIELLVNSIEPELCRECEQFVVNDEQVIEQSKLIRDFKNQYEEELAFLSFDDLNFTNHKVLNFEKETKSKDDPHLSRNQVFFIAKKRKNVYETNQISVLSLSKELYSRSDQIGLSSFVGIVNHLPYVDISESFRFNHVYRIWLLDGSVTTIDYSDFDNEARCFKNAKDKWFKSHPEYINKYEIYIGEDTNNENRIIGIYLENEDAVDFWDLSDINNQVYLFKLKLLKTDQSLLALHVDVLPSGLLAIRKIVDETKQIMAWGLVDKSGNEVLSFRYDLRHIDEYKYIDNPFEEIKPGWIHIKLTGRIFIIQKNEVYDQYTGNFLVKQTLDFDAIPEIQLYDKNTLDLLKTIKECKSLGEEISDGWHIAYNFNTGCLRLVSKDVLIQLSEFELVYDNYAAHTFIIDSHVQQKPYFISDERIVTFIGKSNSRGIQALLAIKIYSYNGDLIKEFEINNNPLLIKQPYKFGKALCFKIRANGKSVDLYYLDLDGNEHLIPYKGGRRIKNYAETEVFLVSEDAFVINNKEDGFWGELRNLNGDVLFKNTSWILPFSGQYLAYYSSKPGKKYGIIDYKGNIIIEPEYDSFELVECSNGVYKHYSMDGNCKELTE